MRLDGRVSVPDVLVAVGVQKLVDDIERRDEAQTGVALGVEDADQLPIGIIECAARVAESDRGIHLVKLLVVAVFGDLERSRRR